MGNQEPRTVVICWTKDLSEQRLKLLCSSKVIKVHVQCGRDTSRRSAVKDRRQKIDNQSRSHSTLSRRIASIKKSFHIIEAHRINQEVLPHYRDASHQSRSPSTLARLRSCNIDHGKNQLSINYLIK